MVRTVRIALLGLAIMSPLSVSAQDTDFESLFKLSLDELLEVTISGATRFDEHLRSVPASTSVFTQDDIRDLGVHSLDQLMNHAPGFQNAGISDSNSSLTHYSSRGRRIVGATREVLILLDGERLNNERSGGLLVDNISLANIERVEFIRGPGSSIYGSNAFLGVINLVSTTTRRNAAVSLGNAGWRSVTINDHKGYSEGDFVSLFVHSNQRDGEQKEYFNPATKTFNESRRPYTGNELYLQAKWRDWYVSFHPREVSTEDFYELDRFDTAVNSNVIRQYPFVVSYKRMLDAHWSMEANVQYAVSDVYYRYNFGTPSAPEIYELLADTQEIQGASTFFWQQDTRKGLFGFEFRQPDLDSSYVETVAGVSTFGEALGGKDERLYRSTFAQWSSELWSNASYILGGRYDDDAFVGSHFSPRSGLIQQISDTQNIKLLYGEAFRSPTRVELDSVFSRGAPQVGNPNLMPEIAKTIELIWSHYQDRHYLTSTLFNTEIQDRIAITQTVPRVYQNAGDERIKGVELEWRWGFASQWTLNARASYFNPSNKFTPESSQLWGMDLIWKAAPLTATLSHSYKGAVKDADNSSAGFHRLPSFNLTALYLNYRVDTEVETFLRIDNLLNQDKLSAANGARNTVGLPIPGRAVVLGVIWNF